MFFASLEPGGGKPVAGVRRSEIDLTCTSKLHGDAQKNYSLIKLPVRIS